MVKRFALCLLALALCLPLGALAAQRRVFDNSGLFTAGEIEELEAEIARLQEKFNMDFVILTDDAARYSSDDDEAERYSLDFADLFYEQGGFGVGAEQDGFLYFIDMSNRLPTISTTGAMIDYVTGSRLKSLLNTATSVLRQGDYPGSAAKVLHQLEGYLNTGIPEGQYRYDVVTGKRLTGRHKALTSGEALAAALAGLAAAGLFALGVVRSYKLKGGAYRYDVAANHTLNLVDSADDYLTTTVSTVRRPDPPSGGSSGGGHSGGSGVHTSSSGGSHGGGSGGRF